MQMTDIEIWSPQIADLLPVLKSLTSDVTKKLQSLSHILDVEFVVTFQKLNFRLHDINAIHIMALPYVLSTS